MKTFCDCVLDYFVGTGFAYEKGYNYQTRNVLFSKYP